MQYSQKRDEMRVKGYRRRGRSKKKEVRVIGQGMKIRGKGNMFRYGKGWRGRYE